MRAEMTVTRFHHKEGWFADLPVKGTEWVSDDSCLDVSGTPHGEPSTGPYVQLTGVVMSNEREEGLVLSMNGLMVRTKYAPEYKRGDLAYVLIT